LDLAGRDTRGRRLGHLTKSGMNDVTKQVFSNGLTVITEAMLRVRSVSIGIWVRTGSRDERAPENGITHFLEHMVFKGTRNRSAEEIARSADSIGGHLDAYTSKEYTTFSIKVLDEHLERAFDVLSDLVKNPLFRAEDVLKERKVIQEEIKMVEDTPDDLVHEIFTQAYWRGHALGRPILGTRRTVAGFDRRRLFHYFRRHYAPNRMLIAAAGNLQHRRIAELVRRAFGDAPRGPAPAQSSAPVAYPHLKLCDKRDLEQVHLCVGAPGYPQAHAKRYALLVLNTVLGGGMSSRLFQNVREKRGLAYAVFSGLSMFMDAGCLSVYAGTSTENTRRVIRLVMEEFHRLKSSALDTEELQRAKDYLKGSLLLSLESSSARMANLARQEMVFGRHISMDEIAAGINAVTSEDVLGVAREIFGGERIALTALGPLNGVKVTRRDLAC
jgi:predicted Zn-dependent peptidase